MACQIMMFYVLSLMEHFSRLNSGSSEDPRTTGELVVIIC